MSNPSETPPSHNPESLTQPDAAIDPLALEDRVANMQLLRAGTREYEQGMRLVCHDLDAIPRPKNHYGLSSSQYMDSCQDIRQETHLKFIQEIHKKDDKGQPTFKPMNVAHYFKAVQAKKAKNLQVEQIGRRSRSGGTSRIIPILSTDDVVKGSHTDDSGQPTTYLDQYDHLQNRQAGLSPSEELHALITEDPEQMFSRKCVTDRPDVNFRAIYLLDVDGFTYQEMAQRFSVVKFISWGTVSSFYHRAILHLLPFFKDYFDQ